MNISNPTEPPDMDIAWVGIAELEAGYRAGNLSPVEVARRLLARIAELNPQVNAVIDVAPERTMAMAEASSARWRAGAPLSMLDGVPVTIKDLAAIRGWPRWRGGRIADDTLMTFDTPAVARLREAGAVFLARTATPEAGCKVVTRSERYGETRNPWDITKTPGGSSGGAAAALAMGFGPIALGSDGAGSLRIPASHSNVVGVKPGFGRVPAFPPDPDMPHSVVGPMARTVADAAIMLDILSRPEPRDPYAWPIPFAMPDLSGDLVGLRVAFSARMGLTAPLFDAEVDRIVAEAAPLLAQAGARVEQAAPDWPVDPFRPFEVFWNSTCVDALARTPAAQRPLLDQIIHAVARRGAGLELADLMRAIDERTQIAAAARDFFNRYDLLIGPVMPVPPYATGRDVPEGYTPEDWDWCPYTYPWNMTGQPALSVPIGFTATGLPVGVQIIGAIGAEALILRAAAAIERARPLWQRHPDIARPGS
ncbi:MAG TPA: amidase family protein [Paenirhodobacter sp.]